MYRQQIEEIGSIEKSQVFVQECHNDYDLDYLNIWLVNTDLIRYSINHSSVHQRLFATRLLSIVVFTGLRLCNHFSDQFVVLVVLQDLIDVGLWADQGEQDGQKHETVEGAKDDDEEVHAEIVELEKCGGGKGEDADTDELGAGDANEHWAAHLAQGFLGPFFSSSLLFHEVHGDVVTELDTKTEACHQVHHEDGVLLDRVPANHDVQHPHTAHKFEENEEDAQSDEAWDLNAGEDL